MTHAAQQTYIQRLGFQDKDRSNQRHGLACEYLFRRLVEQDAQKITEEACARVLKDQVDFYQGSPYGHSKQELDLILGRLGELCPKEGAEQLRQKTLEIPTSDYINVPIRGGHQRQYVNGFADVLSPRFYAHLWKGGEDSPALWVLGEADREGNTLGEVKITPEPAENVIQQIAFYKTYLNTKRVVLLVDYEDPMLKRLTDNSNIEVYRLGPKFESWVSSQGSPTTEEM
jgi:hypothetical protein